MIHKLIKLIAWNNPHPQQQQQQVHKQGAVDAKVQVTATLAETMSPSNTKVMIKLTARFIFCCGNSNL